MKRTLIVTAFLAMGILMATSFAAAQDKAAATSGGQVTIGLLGRTDVTSSKFTEYREVPKGVSIPFLKLFATTSKFDFNLLADNVRQTDQRYTGWFDTAAVGISFDYNQIPHNIGNNGHALWAQVSPGVYGMSPTLRKAWGDTIDATLPTSARNYDFYYGLTSPSFGDANSFDITGLRQHGEVAVDVGRKLPFDLTFTYVRDVKTGNRGESSGTLYGVANTVVDVPDVMNEVTTDYGVRFERALKAGNVHATLNRNVFNERQDSLVIDNPFRATDLTWVSASVPGGSAMGRYGTPPSNEAIRGSFGALLKFKRQTRIAADVALGQWTQNDQFLPYTINSSILTGVGGTPADLTSSLFAQSLNGKMDTTTLNFAFSSRPVDNLGVRLRYRKYDQVDKRTNIIWPGHAGWGDPERAWTTRASVTEAMYADSMGYSNKSDRFDGQVNYDIKGLTLEGAYRYTKLDRTNVEATSGKDNGFALSAVYHATDMLGVRAVYDALHRTASGFNPNESQYRPGTTDTTTYYGLPSNESERKTTRTGVNVEVSPAETLDLTFAYFRRNDDYPNRPARDNYLLDPATTTSGLLSASYDTFTAEIDFNPSPRVELSGYYTYEKNLATDRNITLTASNPPTAAPPAVNNSLRYDVTDKTNTFGASAVFQLVPEKWTFSLMARSQKVDGLMGTFAANQAGSFYTGRVNNGFPGTVPITDYDDTLLTTVSFRIDYAVAKAWKIGAGYAYEKYNFADAFTGATTSLNADAADAANFPVSPFFMMKPNDGPYKANVFYTTLTYRF